jgi:hypothetical protein
MMTVNAKSQAGSGFFSPLMRAFVLLGMNEFFDEELSIK